MITIPLFDVVSYLTRKGVDPVEALEGAPIHMPHIGDGLITFEAPDVSWGDGVYLYLGRDSVCPAAMGWAGVVLWSETVIFEDRPYDDQVRIWLMGLDEPVFTWRWSQGEGDARYSDAQYFDSATPPTPAARLRAVLEYEMGRP